VYLGGGREKWTFMDKFRQLCLDAPIAVVILGNPETSDFELIDLDFDRLPNERVCALQERGMEFCGVLGLVKGRPRVALALPLGAEIIATLSAAFVQRLEDAINGIKPDMGDSAEWLERLHSLPDNRNGVN
jgi:hypothetical protein